MLLGHLFSKEEMPRRKFLYRMLIITGYVAGGMIPTHLIFRFYGLLNNFLVYILPSLISSYYVILIKTFVEQKTPGGGGKRHDRRCQGIKRFQKTIDRGGKRMSRKIMITAHSGCEGTPDNSIASIETGVALGADCVEIDIRMDAQGRLWLTHDLPALFSGLTPVEDAFGLIQKSGIAVNCDLKEYGALLPTLKLAEKCGIGPDQLIFSGSVDTALLAEKPEIARRSRIFLNSEELVRDLSKKEPPDRWSQTAFLLANADAVSARLRGLGAEALNAPYKYMPDELIEKMRERKAALSLWTLNEEAPLKEFMAKDLLNITTRSASLALGIRKAMGRE